MENPEKEEKPYTWRDDLKYGIGAPLVLLSVPVLLIMGVIDLFTPGHAMNWPLFFVLLTIIAAVLL